MSLTALARAIRFEATKLAISRTWWIVLVLVVVVQGLLAVLAGIGYAQVGLDATPATEPSLAEPLPPVQYLGFEVLPFGEAVIVVLAAIQASADYRGHELRTTLLATNRRAVSLLAKVVGFTGLVAVMSLISIAVTIAAVHVGLGGEGLNPLALPAVTWQLIFKSTMVWSLLALATYALGTAVRGWILPMALLLPQVLGVGEWLAGAWKGGAYLPVSAGQCWTATPEAPCLSGSGGDPAVLVVWAVALVGIAAVVYLRRDVGTR
jgi:ABC-2 type transport system permease protein